MNGHHSHVPYTCGRIDHLSYELLCYHRDCVRRRSSSFWCWLLSPFWGCERIVCSQFVGILTDLEESEECSTVFPCWELQAITHYYSSPDHSEGEVFPSDFTWYHSILWDRLWGQHCTPRSSLWLGLSCYIWLAATLAYLYYRFNTVCRGAVIMCGFWHVLYVCFLIPFYFSFLASFLLLIYFFSELEYRGWIHSRLQRY